MEIVETVFEATDENFEKEVLERSLKQPVIVDLWAPWCGPCRTLGPILEKLIRSYQGKLLLAKVNVDENPRVATAFQVQSIPAVYAIKDKAVVDGFLGAIPEGQIKIFLEKLLPEKSEAEKLYEVGKAAKDEAMLRKALELKPDYVEAIETLGELLIDEGRYDEAFELFERISETQQIRSLKAKARLKQAGLDINDDITRKLDELLERVKSDEKAKQEYLDILESLGTENPIAIKYRRLLSSRLF